MAGHFRRRTILTSVLAAGIAGPVWAGSDIGVVVLHGTQGLPGSIVTSRFEMALKNAGYAVQAPEMCWSRNRIYDAPFPDCLHDIDAAAGKLRAMGARRIVIAGQSEGGNAALTYASTHPDIAGVIALAPAGNPQGLVRNQSVQESVTQARQMVSNGHGNDRARFTATNNGNHFTVYTTAAIFLSFTDPEGPAVFPRSLPKITVPVLWVAGDDDRSQGNADAWFATLPANNLNHMAHVSAVHLGTPDAGIEPALAWLRTLPMR
ncbi:carboxylesterase [Acidisphaera sp. S103]|uniref:alpha/beta hydrolase n=1 Tax=Acidisphaera sp. S103 TaxID=1747223 RepID=UPI00131D8A75|nr:alpha/beta hydrolase [Acidisphaera sp. S103]